jgi:DNA-binding transcriptional LysR family regulator
MSRIAPPIVDIAAFVAVAQNASFTRAAEQLATTKSNIGKAVQRLEGRLGTRLFQRTTRAVRLTEDGETYLEAARAALED